MVLICAFLRLLRQKIIVSLRLSASAVDISFNRLLIKVALLPL